MTISDYAELAILNAVLNNTALAVANVYVKLHIGDPGENGAGNPAAETTRKAISFAAAASGQCVSDADVSWNPVAATEIYSHISLWDALTTGNCLWTGPLAAPKSVTAGDEFRLPSGQVTVSLD